MKAHQSLLQPICTLAARNAPPATLMLIKLHSPQRKLHNALRIIDYDHPAGTKHRTSFRDRIEIHIQVDLIGGEAGTRSPARYNGFQRAPIRNAAAHFVNHLLQVVAHRQLINARFSDISAKAKQPSPAILRRTNLGKPFRPAENNVGHAGQSFRIINNRRTAPQPHHGRKWRPNPRNPALALERLHQSRFFSDFISPRAAMPVNLEIASAPKNVLPEKTLSVSIANRLLHDV